MTKEEFLTQAGIMEAEIIELNKDIRNKVALYKAFTKEHTGMADGEPVNVRDVLDKVAQLG